MSRSTELLALQKEVLLARSSLGRLKIRRDMGRMRESLSFGGVASGIAASGPAAGAVSPAKRRPHCVATGPASSMTIRPARTTAASSAPNSG